MTKNKRYVQFEFPHDDFAVRDNQTNEELWNPKVVDRLNNQEDEIQQLKWSNKVLRANRKDCELGRREERKRWLKMDKMRIEHIQLLQKRLKDNGLSIYVYGDDTND